MTRSEPNLRIPGPTSLPPTVREAGGRQMINHRGPEFKELLGRLQTGMKPYFGTTSDIAILTCAGTGGLEAAVVNTLSPGDRVLAVSIGAFGDRFAKIAEAYGANVDRVSAEWGWAAAPDEVRERLAGGDVKAVLLTHNETSTGVMNPIPELAAAIHATAPDALILVDTVSSLGAVPFDMDAWGIDVVATASQKAWMAAPGAGDGRRVGARLGGDGDRDDAALLPRPAPPPRRDGRRRDAMDAGDRRRLPGRRGSPADERGGPGRRVRQARRVRGRVPGRARGARLRAVRRGRAIDPGPSPRRTFPTASTGGASTAT